MRLALGVPLAGIESMVGVCINTVPRRLLLDRQMPVLELLKNIQAEQMDISQYEYITLPEIDCPEVQVSGLFRSLLNIRTSSNDIDIPLRGENALLTATMDGFDGYALS